MGERDNANDAVARVESSLAEAQRELVDSRRELADSQKELHRVRVLLLSAEQQLQQQQLQQHGASSSNGGGNSNNDNDNDDDSNDDDNHNNDDDDDATDADGNQEELEELRDQCEQLMAMMAASEKTVETTLQQLHTQLAQQQRKGDRLTYQLTWVESVYPWYRNYTFYNITNPLTSYNLTLTW